jgi:hypothetical protein
MFVVRDDEAEISEIGSQDLKYDVAVILFCEKFDGAVIFFKSQASNG